MLNVVCSNLEGRHGALNQKVKAEKGRASPLNYLITKANITNGGRRTEYDDAPLHAKRVFNDDETERIQEKKSICQTAFLSVE